MVGAFYVAQDAAFDAVGMEAEHGQAKVRAKTGAGEADPGIPQRAN